MSDYYRQKKSIVRTTLENLIKAGSLRPVRVEGWKQKAVVNQKDLSLIEEIKSSTYQSKLTTFLSPFDNLTWNRNRLRDLFSFDYRIEMYTPVSERKYGYYVMPILHRGRLVGRLDPKADRKTGTLVIQTIQLEPNEMLTDELLSGIADALREFMDFHNCEALLIKHSVPSRLQSMLTEQVALT